MKKIQIINYFKLEREKFDGSIIESEKNKDLYQITLTGACKEVDDAEFNLQSEKKLRFGNSLVQITNMIHIARYIGKCTVHLPDYWYLSKKEKFTIADGVQISVTKQLIPNGITFTGTFFYLRSFRPICKDLPNRFEIINQLKPLLALKEEDALDDDELVIHVRAGDVFSLERPHPEYGQPPFSFYKKIIISNNWKSVYVVCEDLGNPVIELISKYCAEIDIICNIISKGLKSDIEFLLRARQIVAGYGTFIPSIVALSSRIKIVYIFEAEFETWSNPYVRVIKIRDVIGEYKRAVLQGNWKNSKEQLIMMGNYPLLNLEFE